MKEPRTSSWELECSTTEVTLLLEWLAVWVRTIIEIDPNISTVDGNWELGSFTTGVTLLLEWLAVWVRTIIEIDPPLFRIVCQHAHSHEICFSTKGETETMQYNISIQSLQDKVWGKMFSEVKYKMNRKSRDKVQFCSKYFT